MKIFTYPLVLKLKLVLTYGLGKVKLDFDEDWSIFWSHYFFYEDHYFFQKISFSGNDFSKNENLPYFWSVCISFLGEIKTSMGPKANETLLDVLYISRPLTIVSKQGFVFLAEYIEFFIRRPLSHKLLKILPN